MLMKRTEGNKGEVGGVERERLRGKEKTILENGGRYEKKFKDGSGRERGGGKDEREGGERLGFSDGENVSGTLKKHSGKFRSTKKRFKSTSRKGKMTRSRKKGRGGGGGTGVSKKIEP